MDVDKYKLLGALVENAGLAQDVLMSLLLPYHTFFFSSGGALIVLCGLLGSAWMLMKALVDPMSRTFSHLLFVFMALIFFIPVPVDGNSGALSHASSKTNEGFIEITDTRETYKVSLGMFVFMNFANLIEDMLYEVKGVTDYFEDGSNLATIQALSMPLIEYADEKDYTKVVNDYLRLCSSVPDNDGNQGIAEGSWYMVGLRGGGGLGLGGDISHIAMMDEAQPSRLRRFLGWIFSDTTWNEVTQNFDVGAAREALSRKSLVAAKSAAARESGHKILSEEYWAAKFGAPTSQEFEQYDVVNNRRFYRFPEEAEGSTIPESPEVEGEERYSWYTRTCEDMYEVADKATANLRNGMKKGLNKRAGAGHAGLGDLASSEFSSSALVHLYKQAALQNGLKANSAVDDLGLATKGELAELYEGFFSWWKVDMVVAGSIATASFGIALLFTISPLLIAFSMVPGKQGMLAFMLESILVLKLALFLMFFVLDAGSTVLDGMMRMATLNMFYGGSIGMAGLAPILQMSGIIMSFAIGGVFVFAYMLVFMSSRHLGSINGGAAGQAITKTGITAAGAAIALGTSGVGKAAIGAGGRAASAVGQGLKARMEANVFPKGGWNGERRAGKTFDYGQAGQINGTVGGNMAAQAANTATSATREIMNPVQPKAAGKTIPKPAEKATPGGGYSNAGKVHRGEKGK